MSKIKFIVATFLTTISWAISGGIGYTLSGNTLTIHSLNPFWWMIGGGLTALILYWINPKMKWFQILALFMGWWVSWPFALAGSIFVSMMVGIILSIINDAPEMVTMAFIIGITIGVTLAGTLGGLIIGIVLKWVDSTFHWTQISVIAVGWAIAWIIGVTISWGIRNTIVSPVGWGVSGMIGSGLMFWQLSEVMGKPLSSTVEKVRF